MAGRGLRVAAKLPLFSIFIIAVSTGDGGGGGGGGLPSISRASITVSVVARARACTRVVDEGRYNRGGCAASSLLERRARGW